MIAKLIVPAALLVTVTLSGCGPKKQGPIGPEDPPAPKTRAQIIEQGTLAVAKVISLDDNEKQLGHGSGTIIDKAGYILTNWHVVGMTDDEVLDRTGQGHSPGEMHNKNGLVLIAIPEDTKTAPTANYVGLVVAGDSKKDLAVVKIVSRYPTTDSLEASLKTAPIELGDSDLLKRGDPLYILGYPGVRQDTPKFTSSEVSGPTDLDRDGKVDIWVIEGTVSPGNSGGMALDATGKLVGVPTWTYDPEAGSSLDGMVAINTAKALIDEAISFGGTRIGPPAKDLASRRLPTPNRAQLIGMGTIVEEGTGNPVSDATFEILQPDRTSWSPVHVETAEDIGSRPWDQTERSIIGSTPSGSLVVCAAGTSDQAGGFRLRVAPGAWRMAPLYRGLSYDCRVSARGYADFVGTIRIPEQGPLNIRAQLKRK
ncbi:MAG: trypsin-like peptidase domain-containing protein [Armatimonadetes bacterium]|nr:trypsin-like peptidase domain-containing protein [Armatimonadota bacterium]